MSLYRKVILKNGLKVLLVPQKYASTTVALILVGTGSRYERKKDCGISHLLEHMLFKGTKKRKSQFELMKDLDRVGGAYNGFTDRELTGFYVHLGAGQLSLALDILSDMLLNSVFREKDLKKEKKVILEEIHMIQDHPARYLGDLWERLLYGNQPAGRPVIGFKNTLIKISRKNLINYLKRQYGAPNLLLVIAGKFDQNKVLKKIKEYFLAFKKIKPQPKEKIKEIQKKPEILLFYKKTDQTHLALGVRTFSLFHPDRYVLACLAVILGGYMSSRLFQEIREKRGLAYYISTLPQAYSDCGYLLTLAGVDNKKIKEAISAILKEYQKIKTQPVSEEELSRAKEFLKGRLNLSLQTPPDFATFFGTQLILTKKILTPDQIKKKIEKITQKDILRVAKKIFLPQRLNLALIGPIKEKNKILNLLKL
jgi:predicted Zn-dependent peptidase